MPFTRKNIAERLASKTMEAIVTGSTELANWTDKDKAECKAEVDGLVTEQLDQMKVEEREEFIAASLDMFASSLDDIKAEDRAVVACKRRRLLAKRIGEAKLVAAYINAEIKHGTDAAARCEQFRKVATMRTAWSQIESDLVTLIKQANIPGLVGCKANEKGRLVKAKASHAASMALENLRNALATRRTVIKQANEIADLKSAKPETKAAA